MMKITTFTALLSAASLVEAVTLPPGVPRSVGEFREKHPYAPSHPGGPNGSRHVVTIRPSRNDTDDVSAAFKAGLERANHGGTLYLPANQTFVIGEPLDLTFLDDVQVRLDGEIKFTDDTEHWQSVAYTHPFQDTIMFWKWGGNKVKIYGEGVLNGNGQRWWDEFAGGQILDPDNTYLRPVLFYAQNATDLVIEGIHMKDSPCWTNFVVTCKSNSPTFSSYILLVGERIFKYVSVEMTRDFFGQNSQGVKLEIVSKDDGIAEEEEMPKKLRRTRFGAESSELIQKTASGVSYADVVITAVSNNASVLPANTDFFDSLNIEHLTVQRTWVNIGDDCFSPKTNATDVYVDTMYCNGKAIYLFALWCNRLQILTRQCRYPWPIHGLDRAVRRRKVYHSGRRHREHMDAQWAIRRTTEVLGRAGCWVWVHR